MRVHICKSFGILILLCVTFPPDSDSKNCVNLAALSLFDLYEAMNILHSSCLMFGLCVYLPTRRVIDLCAFFMNAIFLSCMKVNVLSVRYPRRPSEKKRLR